MNFSGEIVQALNALSREFTLACRSFKDNMDLVNDGKLSFQDCHVRCAQHKETVNSFIDSLTELVDEMPRGC